MLHKKLNKRIKALPTQSGRAAITLYRALFQGQITRQNCRFEPTCSHYAEEAIDQHGLLKGSYLGAKRIMRCHPWSDYGLDPVPEKFVWRRRPDNDISDNDI